MDGFRSLIKRKKNSFLVSLFMLPTLVVFSLFMFFPIAYSLYLSFYSWNMVSPNKKWVEFNNYILMLLDPETYQALLNTGIYIVILLVLNFILPYLVAYIMARLVKRGSSFYKSAIFFPSLLSLAVAAIIFVWLFNPIAGPVTALLAKMGVSSPMWFQTPGCVILVLSLITAWKSFGYNLIVLLAAVQEVPLELIEAAKLEKASNWTIFWRIIRPLTSATAFYVFTITIVFGLQYVFTPIHILTQGGPNQASTNIVYLIYQYGFTFFQTGRAAAISIVTLIIFIGFLVVQKWLEKKVHYEN